MASNEVRKRTRQFLERLLNNNEPEYFYLHEDAALGLAESACAFLRLSIGLRAYQHYDVLLAARVLSLTEGFQAKLGWMAGNLYARVGTEDWVPGAVATRREFDKHIGEVLDKICTWVDSERLAEAARTFMRDPTRRRRKAIREHIERTQVIGRRERAIDSVVRVLRSIGVDQEDTLNALQRGLRSDPEFKASVPQKATEDPEASG